MVLRPELADRSQRDRGHLGTLRVPRLPPARMAQHSARPARNAAAALGSGQELAPCWIQWLDLFGRILQMLLECLQVRGAS